MYSELDIIQNPALGSMCLWQFIVEYYKSKGKKEGAILPYIFFVLPIVLNKESCCSISNRNFEGGLHLAVTKDKAFSSGIQARAINMYDLTWKSLNIALASDLLSYNSKNTEIVPNRLTNPESIEDSFDLKEILAASKRLGRWFAVLPIEEIALLLNVRF